MGWAAGKSGWECESGVKEGREESVGGRVKEREYWKGEGVGGV